MIAQLARRRVAWGAWTRLVVASLARVIVLSAVGGLVWSMLPFLLGWQPTTVMSDSMAPRFLTGDVAVSMPATPQLENIGAILLVDDPDHPGRLRLHRMYDVTPDGEIVTKGDANAQPDSSHITPEHVHGVAVLRIPFVGLPVVWARYHEWGLLAAAGASFLALVLLSTIDADLRSDGAGSVPLSRRAERRARRRARIVPSVLLVGSASVVTLVLVVTTGAHAAFGSSTANPASSWSATSDFACWPTGTAADSPYFYYRFDKAGTPTTDASGNGRTGAFGSGASGAAGTCPSAGVSPALSVDGTANGIVTPAASAAIAGPTTFSLEAWFKTSTAGGKIVGFGSSQTGTSGTYDRHLYIGSDGKLYFGVYPGSVKTITSGTVVSNGAWHHAVATLSTAGMRLYLDGSLVASDVNTTGAQSFNGYWRIGYDNTGGWTNNGANGFVGLLDNVAVYTTALSSTQVTSHYQTGH